MARRFYIETLGCPKNQVDSDKLVGTLVADGLERADAPEDADVVVVNTCAFVESARQESVETILGLAEARLQMGDLDAASHAAQQALAVEPGHATALAVWQRVAGTRTAGLPQP